MKSFKKQNPDINDILALHKKDIMLSMNCHAIGQIQSFDANKQTCTAQITYSKTLYERSSSGEYKSVLVPYPLLIDVPVIVIHGGSGGLTMPIKKGDFCLVLFNDRDMDNWFSGATAGALNSSRLHSMADGIAIVGLRQSTKPLNNYDAEKTVLFLGENKISIGQNEIIIEKGAAKITVGTKVKIEVGGQKLGTLISQLCDAITQNVPITTSSGSPVNASAQTAAVNIAKTAIQGVLE